MKFNLTRDKQTGEHAMNRILVLVTAGVLSTGFLKESWMRPLGLWDWLGYSCGMALSYAPSAVVKVIQAWRGQGTDTPPPDGPAAAQPPAPDGVN